MTYFLDDKPVERRASGRTGGLPTTFDSFAAVWTSSNLEGGYRNFENRQTQAGIKHDMMQQAIDALGKDAIRAELERENADIAKLSGLLRDDPNFWENSPEVAAAATRLVEQDRAANPDRWKDWSLDEDDLLQRSEASLRADYDEAQQIIAMSPESITRDLAAEIGSGIANLKSIPFLVMGGGTGSFWSVVGREAAINMGVEATLLPSQFQAAEDLEIGDPNVLANLGMAGVAGGVFGGMAEGAARGLRYFTGRKQAVPQGMDPLEAELLTQRLEGALSGPRPMEAARDVIEGTRPVRPEPPPGLPPLVLRPEDRAAEGFARTEPPAGWREGEVTTEVLPPIPGETRGVMDVQSLTAMSEEAIREAERLELRATGGKQSPLLQAMKRAGIRFNPDTPEGQELTQLLGGRNQANKTVPGLFSRKGSPHVDNIPYLDNMVAVEWEDRFPGITAAAGVDNGYLSRDGVYDLIRREAAKDFSWMQDMQEAASIRRGAQMSAVDEWQAKTPIDHPNALFVNREAMMFDRPEWEVERDIGQMVDDHIDRIGFRLSDAERAEVRYEIQKNGGDVDLLLERVALRNQEFGESADEIAQGLPARSPEEAGGSDAGEAGPVPGEARGVAEGVGYGEPSAFPIQRTAIGDQLVVPGAERVQTGVAQRAQAEAAARQQQSMIRRGGQQRVEDDPESLFGGGQNDLFDDPASPETRVIHDAIADDTRRAIETEGDFLVDMGDGKGERLASTVLDDLDKGDVVAARLELCGSAPGGAA